MFNYNHYRIISCMCAGSLPDVQIITGGEQLTIYPSRVSQPSTPTPSPQLHGNPLPTICLYVYLSTFSVYLSICSVKLPVQRNGSIRKSKG